MRLAGLALTFALCLSTPGVAQADKCEADVSPGTPVATVTQNVSTPPIVAMTVAAVNGQCFTSRPIIALDPTSPPLPAGLSLNIQTTNGTQTATIVGTPTYTPAYPTEEFVLIFTGTPPGGDPVSYPVGLIVTRAISSQLNTAAMPSGSLVVRAGVASSTSPVTALYGAPVKRWSISPSLPAGLSIDSATGVISGAATVGAPTPTAYTISITDQAISATGTAASGTTQQTFNLVIQPAIVTTVNSPPVIVTGVAVTPFQPVSASGGVGAITYALSGQLPPGLSFSSSTGQISGTATSAFADSAFSVTATDSLGFTSSKSFTLQYSGPSARVDIASKTLTSGDQELGFTPVAKIGGTSPVTYSISPALPAGLSISPSTGTISGRPTQRIAPTTFTVTVTDSGSPQGSASKTFTLEVVAADPIVYSVTPTGGSNAGGTTVTITGLNFGPAYADATTVQIGGVAISGVSFASDGRSLSFTTPALSLGGAPLVGLPTLKVQNQGSSYYTPGLSFALRNALVSQGPIQTQNIKVGQTVFFPTILVGPNAGSGTVTYSISGLLPNGLNFDTQTGYISGVVGGNLVGQVGYTVTVTDSDSPPSSIIQQGLLNVTPVLSVTAGGAQILHNGQSASFSPVTVSNGVGQLHYSVSPNLPNGLAIDASTGVISGAPNLDSFNCFCALNYTVTVSDSQTPLAATGSATFSMTVKGFTLLANPSYAANDLRVYDLEYTSGWTYGSYTGGAYSTASATVAPAVAAGGVGVVTYSISPALPAGLSFNSATGEIGGAPTARSAAATYTITATDSDSPSNRQTYPVKIGVSAANGIATAITPSHGTTDGGTAVTLTGLGFGPKYANATTVTLNGAPVTNLVIAAAGTSMTFNTPASTTSGPAVLRIANDTTVTQQTLFTYDATPALVATVALPNLQFARNLAGSYSPVTVTGGLGALHYAISPTLPAGLSINATTGVVSGTASSLASAANYTITVTDSSATPLTAQGVFSLTVGNAPTIASGPTFSSMSPTVISVAGGTRITVRGTNFTPATFFGIGGTNSYLATNVVVSADGTSATMTAPNQGGGNGSVNISTSFGTSSTAGVFTVAYPPSASLNLAGGGPWAGGAIWIELNKPVTAFKPVTVTGGLGAITYSAKGPGGGPLPAGLIYNSSTGQLSGTPTAVIGSGNPSTMDVTFTATDSDNPSRSSSATASLTIFSPMTLQTVVPSLSLAPGVDMTPTTPVKASGGYAYSVGSATPYGYSVSPALPGALTLDANTGQISGIPGVTAPAQTYTLSVQDFGTGAPFGSVTKTATFTLEVKPFLSAAKVADVSVGVGQSIATTPVTASGGIGAITYDLSGSLPAGVSFSRTTGALSGAATAPWPQTTYTVTASDSSPTPVTARVQFTLAVNAALPTITGLSRHTATGGTQIVITGTGFVQYPTLPGVVEVGFTSAGGTAAATSYHIDSDTQITLTAPAIGGAWDAYVKLPQGQTTTSSATAVVFGALPDIPITLSTAATSVTGDFVVQVTAAEAVTGLTAGNVSVTNGAVSAFSGNGMNYLVTIHPTANGLVTVQVGNFAAGAHGAVSGAGIAASNTLQVGYRAGPVQVTIVAVDASHTPITLTNQAVELDFTFTEGVTNFSAASLVLGAGSTLTNFTAVSPSRYTAILDHPADGVATVTLPSGVVKDVNGLVLDTTAQSAITFDRTAPSLQVVGPPLSLLQSQPFSVRLTFSKDVVGFDATKISVSRGALVSLTPIDGQKVYSAIVRPSGTGVLQLSFALYGVTDKAGNAATFPFTSSSLPDPLGTGGSVTTSGPAFYIDADAPYVAISQTSGSNPTAAPFDVKIAFTQQDLSQFGYTGYVPGPDAVTSFTLSGLTVTNGSASGLNCLQNAPGAGQFGSAITECAARITPTGAGPVTVSAPAGAAADRAGNPTRPSNVLTVQMPGSTVAAPVLTITRPLDVTNGPQIVTFSFSKPVTGFDQSALVAGAGTTIANFSAVDASTYRALVGRTSTGLASVAVTAAAGRDAVGLPTPAGSTSFTVDLSPPTTLLAVAGGATTLGPVPFDVTVTFSKPVTGFGLAGLYLINATASNLRGASGGATYVVTVTPATSGDVQVGVLAGAGKDVSGNPSAASTVSTLTIDRLVPTPALSMVTPAPSVTGPFDIQIAFNKAVTGFDISRIGVTNGAAAGLKCDTGDGAAPPSVKVCTATITPTLAGPVGITLAAGAAVDRVGTASVSASLTVPVYAPNPALTIAGPTSVQTAPFRVTLTFSSPVTGLAVSAIVGTNATISDLQGSGASYSALVTPLADGPVKVDVAAGVVVDANRRPNLAATFSVVADVSPIVPTITGPSTPQIGPFTATVTFSKPATGFAAKSLIATNATISNFAGSAAVYTATVTPVADGAVTLNIAAGAASDVNGKLSQAAAPYTVMATLSRVALPTVQAKTLTTAFRTPVSIDLATLTTGNVVSVQVATPATSGTVVIVGTVATYTPAAAFSGTDSFTFTATGPGGVSAPASITVNVGAPSPPTVQAKTLTTALQTPVSIDLATLTTGNVVSVQVATPATSGTVVIVGTVATYTPAAAFSGTDSFTFTATGPGGVSAPASITVNVGAPLPPTVQAKTLTTAFQTPVSIDLATLTTGNVVSVQVATPATGGTVVIAGTVATYTPGAAFSGTDSFTFTATGPGGVSAPASITVNVGAPPPPTVQAKTLTTAFQTPVSIDLATLTTGNVASVQVATPATSGTVVIVGTVATYTPGAVFSGPDSFTFTATGPGGVSAPASITVNVGAPPPPTVQAKTLTTAFQTPVSIDLATLTTGNVASVQVATPATGGTVVIVGTVATYTPGAVFSGPDSFTFTATGPGGVSAPASITVNVAAPPPPVASAKTLTLSVTASSGAARTSTIDLSDAVKFAAGIQIVTPPQHGTLTIQGFVVTYTPTPGYFGTDSFAYVAVGYPGSGGLAMLRLSGPSAAPTVLGAGAGVGIGTGVALSAPATVNLTLQPPTLTLKPTSLADGQAAVAYSQTLTAAGGTAPYTYTVASGALPHGLSLNAVTGVISGVPLGAEVATFTVVATDSSTGTGPFSVSQALTLTVPGPTVTNQTVSVLAGRPFTVHVTTGAVGGPFTSVAVVTPPAIGSAVPSGLDIIYTAPIIYSGRQTFTFTVSNAAGVSLPATVNVTVNPVPITPGPMTVQVPADKSAQADVTTGGSGGPFTAAAVVSMTPSNAGAVLVVQTGGTAGTNATYALKFTPALHVSGPVVVSYTLSNAFATSAPGTVTFNVAARGDPSRDATVRGLITAQSEAMIRFADTQISAVNQRLEGLHEAGGGHSQNGLGFQIGQGAEPPGPDQNPARMFEKEALLKTFASNDERMQPRRTPGSTAQAQSATPWRKSTPAGAGAGADLRPTMGEGGDTAAPDRWSFWTAGSIDLGLHRQNGELSKLKFTTSGITIGGDYRLSKRLVLGAAAGFGEDVTKVGSEGSRSKATSYSLAVYGSYHSQKASYVDGLIGVSRLSFDSRRWYADAPEFETGKRDGSEVFGSLTSGWEFRRDHAVVTPYARISAVSGTLDAFTETGGVGALAFSSQSVKSLKSTFGLRGDYLFHTHGADLQPRFRIELSHEFQNPGAFTLQYADWLNGPVYSGLLDQNGQDHASVGIGLDYRLPNLSVAVDLKTDAGGKTTTSQQVSGKLNWKFR